jgi:bifunctional oligoribonuclease and PAP phosphatase NrnA
MRLQNKVKQLDNLLLNAKNVLIAVHMDPDVDAIGSALALRSVLIRRNISCVLWSADICKDNFSFLPNFTDVSLVIPDNIEFDLVISLDVARFARIYDFSKIERVRKNISLINIDHHSDNSLFGDLNIVENVSSVGELLYEIFRESEVLIDADIATCLYAAISFDTGSFSYSNVSPKTLKIASELLGYGASASKLSQAMFENKTIEDFCLMKTALERFVVSKKYGYAYTSLLKEDESKSFKIIDFIRQLSGIEVFLAFQERENDEVKISLRSRDFFSVQKFSAIFDGGGHFHASGIRMKGSLEEVISIVIERLEKELSIIE